MADEIKFSGDSRLDGKLIEGHVKKEQTKLDRGLIGFLLGSSDSVPKNVAAVIALFASFALIVFVVKWAGSPELGYKESIASLSSLVTLTVGYLFGRSSKD